METIKIELTQEEAEVVSNCILRRMQSLENAKLEDSFCYPRLESAYYKIINNIKEDK